MYVMLWLQHFMPMYKFSVFFVPRISWIKEVFIKKKGSVIMIILKINHILQYPFIIDLFQILDNKRITSWIILILIQRNQKSKALYFICCKISQIHQGLFYLLPLEEDKISTGSILELIQSPILVFNDLYEIKNLFLLIIRLKIHLEFWVLLNWIPKQSGSSLSQKTDSIFIVE